MTSTDYKLLDSQLHALLDDEPDALAAASNFVALLYGAMNNINWLGIYVLRGDELVLGPCLLYTSDAADEMSEV